MGEHVLPSVIGSLVGITGIGAISWVDEIGRSLREGFFMFWETLWPLVFGFALSGMVQAFVSREAMQRNLGDHRPAAIARASGYGMLSSSCSYAASAMAKSLFVKGADFVAANVFMFASTNLVIELGIVLAVLIGWQFLAAEFVGGALMIVFLAIAGSFWLRGRVVLEARARLETAQDAREHDHGALESSASSSGSEPLGHRIRSAGAWADAATYTMADLTMLRRELVVGFTVAGFLAVTVPVSLWNDVFMHGHGWWTSIENALVAPFIAVVSFVCSIGNVPLAAALWRGGISFGGVVAFLFADLIAMPLLFIYRRYYGTRLALRMLVVFWAVMSTAGLVTQALFRGVGLVPTKRPTRIAPTAFTWGYTTYLDLLAIGVLGLLYWTYRNRVRLGGGGGRAIDPVCGMQVETAHAPASSSAGGRRVYFCSDRCKERFLERPERFADALVSDGGAAHREVLGPR